MGGWLAQNWFNLLSAIGIIASLLFTAVSLRSETKTRRISNLLTLTQNHRELWTELIHSPALRRVLDPTRNTVAKPPNLEEKYFVTLAIQHLHSAYRAMQTGLVTQPAGIKEDIRKIFSLPVPRAVWEQARPMQNQDFADFVDSALRTNEKQETNARFQL